MRKRTWIKLVSPVGNYEHDILMEYEEGRFDKEMEHRRRIC